MTPRKGLPSKPGIKGRAIARRLRGGSRFPAEACGGIGGGAGQKREMALRLNVKLLTGQLHSLTTSPNKTVWDFKIQVELKTGISPYQQKLAFQKDTLVDLQDGTQLSAYGLESGTTLLLVVKNEESINVFLKNDRGVTNTYQVLPSDLVSQFREQVQRRENIHTDQFWLVYEGKPLENGCRLSDYKIAPNGTIFLNLRLRGGSA